jgi:DNA-binding XRE family transcriptional regulator
MIPDLDRRGQLPPGIHRALFEEVIARFGGKSLWSLAMIKNEAQLRQAMDRLDAIEKHLDDLRKESSGFELETLARPVSVLAEEIRGEIREYLVLRASDLQGAICGPLAKPVLLENIGDLLAKLRIAAGLTQNELAQRLGWHQSNLSRFESETYSGQTISKVSEVASALGVYLLVSPSLTPELEKASITACIETIRNT